MDELRDASKKAIAQWEKDVLLLVRVDTYVW